MMKFLNIIQDYILITTKSFKLIYILDKKGAIGKLLLLALFPIVEKILLIIGANFTNKMQIAYGSNTYTIILPIFILYIFIKIFDDFLIYLNNKISFIWQNSLRLLLETNMINKETLYTIPFLDSKDIHDINQRIHQNGGTQSQLELFRSIPEFLSILVDVIFAIYIVFNYNIYFAILILAISIPKFNIAMKRTIGNRKIDEENMKYSRITNSFKNALYGLTSLKDVKMLGNAKYLLNIYKSRRTFMINLRNNHYKKYYAYSFYYGVFISLIIGILQFKLLNEIITGTMLIGTFGLISSQMYALLNSINHATNFFPNNYSSILGSQYLFLYQETLENTDITNKEKFIYKNNYIKLENIKFQYPKVRLNEMHTLNEKLDKKIENLYDIKINKEIDEEIPSNNNFELNIDTLKIHKGERVAIVGKNGNGKTTLIQLILGLFPANIGKIEIFGNNIHEVNTDDLNKNFTTLFQDYSGHHFKVCEYIAESNIENIDMERVKYVAEIADANEFIEKWKNGYDEQLGINLDGVKPSKGQWQKLALARTLYKDADIIILDEPTAAIDSLSAKKIYENLNKVSSDKILIFISHAMHDIPKLATRILLIDNGKIIADGTHEELLKTSENYLKMTL